MNIAIVGSSGFVGTELKKFFEEGGHKVHSLKVRNETSTEQVSSALEGMDVLINLSGLSIFGRWDEAYKRSLYESRIGTTSKLIEGMKGCSNKPKCFISSSAVGIYPNDILCDEDQNELAESFLAKVCKDWEKEALKADALGVRTLVFRSGVVLGKSGGMLQKTWLPFSLGLGGRIGSGKQPLSWIHIHDVHGVYLKAVEDEHLKGIYNLCAPNAATNLEFTKALGTLMRRPAIFPLPAWLLKLLFKEGSSFMLEGQNAYPKRLLEAGFAFKYSRISEALKSFF